MLALLAAVAAGVTAGGVLGAIATGDPIYIILWSLALPVAIVAAVFAGLRSAGAFDPARAASVAAGSPAVVGDAALARVERVHRAGAPTGDRTEVDLTLTVAPDDRAAYSTTHREFVAQAALDELQPGSIIVVRRPDAASADVVLDLDPPADLAARRDAEQLRSGAERTVPLASEAPRWTSDPRAPGPQRARSGRRAWRTAFLGAVVVVTAVLVLVPAFDSIGRLSRALASGDPASAGVVLGDRHQEIVEALARETGGTVFIRIGFYGDYALASAPSAPGALTIDGYEYRYDRTEHGGPDPIQPDDPAAELFDVDQVDFSRVPEFIEAAKEDAGISDPDSVIVLVDRSTVADDSGERPVQVLVLLDAPYENASVVVDPETGRPAE
ncbi:hypothetical protein [Agromyces bracchium]|uniref:Uncharacterized protein n=1 Tax=Agromyces bracchium TaxID=88376 RepID=A0A6I3M2T0_9MICO|nr:hypothetical protein [Agromyces bracchium]MTH67644.1 hypothetical protein [Agromyces bracchium]